MGSIFDHVAFHYPILQAINDGYLVPVDQQYVYLHGLDLSSVRTTAGDLDRKQMDAIVSRNVAHDGIVDATIWHMMNGKHCCFPLQCTLQT